jgi:hypothetical protein
MASNDKAGIAFAQPQSDAERTAVAGKCCKALAMSIPMVVDGVDDRVGNLYSGMPDRLYLIGADGRVLFKSGRGPFGFNARELEQAMAIHLLDRGPAAAAGRR